METTRVIKRYQNRKLYDTTDSVYVTLDVIAKKVKAGEEIVVVDNRNQDDITASTLTQVVFELQRQGTVQLPIATLRHIIQSSDGTLVSFLDTIGNGGQLEVVRTLENQVRELSLKLDELEKKLSNAQVPSAPVITGVNKGISKIVDV